MTNSPERRPTLPLVLTIDVGSSSVRALLVDATGAALPDTMAREPHAFRTGPAGLVEDDAEPLLSRIERCIDGALQRAGPLAQQIVAVASDTYVSNVLGIDEQGNPLTPIYPYADTRNAEQALALRSQLDEAAVLERTGCLLRTAYLPARLAWLYATNPQVAQRVWRWVSVGELLLLRLFGQCQVSYSVASWSGLLNRRTLSWDAPLLAALGLDARLLSPLSDTTTSLSGLRAPYAARWPALAQVPWFPALGDGATANIGSGCTTPGRIALTIGTTGALRVVAPAVARVPWGLWCYRVDGQRALLGGATSEGGNVFAWLTRTLQLGSEDAIEQALVQSEPDAHGLTVLPFWAGERSPGYAGDVRASIVGLSLTTTPEDMLRASLEAVAYRLALIARLLDDVLPGTQQVIASGGALSKSPAWSQLIADVLGHTLLVSAEEEATSRGAALLALEALGLVPDLATLEPAVGRVHTPNRQHQARYQEAIGRQEELYSLLVTSNQ